MMQRMIQISKGTQLEFFVMRHHNIYMVKLLKYRGQIILIVWMRDDPHDCDFLILSGKRKDMEKAIIGFDVDRCCCDECCTGCA